MSPFFPRGARARWKIFEPRILESFIGLLSGIFFFEPLCTEFLSAKRTCSGDALRKKTSIRAEMLDGGEDVEGVVHHHGLS